MPPQLLVLQKLGRSLQAFDYFMPRYGPSLMLKLNYCAARDTSLRELKGKAEAIGLVPRRFWGYFLDPIAVVSVWNFPKAATIVCFMILHHGLDKI